MKKIILTLGILLILAAGAIFYIFQNAGSLIKTGINRFAHEFTGVETHVNSVSLNPWSGVGRIHGFFLGNPKSFKTDSAVTVDNIQIIVDKSSLTSPVLTIQQVTIDSPQITWEGNLVNSNLSQIQKNLGQRSSENKNTDSKAIKIKTLRITHAKIRLSLAGTAPVTLPLPDLQLNNLGGDSGASQREIASAILEKIISSIGKLTSSAPQLLEQGTNFFKKLVRP